MRMRSSPVGFDPSLLEVGGVIIPAWAYLANGLIGSVDFSNWQPAAQTTDGLQGLLNQLGYKPWHIIIRLSHESAAMRQIARNQLAATRALGLGEGGYGWAYGPISPKSRTDDPRDAVKAFLATGAEPPVLWIDAEGETDLPTITWMVAAFDEAHKQGFRPGIYSNPSWLQPHFGGTQVFAGEWLWNANYNGRMDLDVPTWGGMKVVGHQFSSTPFDQSVFDPIAVVRSG